MITFFLLVWQFYCKRGSKTKKISKLSDLFFSWESIVPGKLNDMLVYHLKGWQSIVKSKTIDVWGDCECCSGVIYWLYWHWGRCVGLKVFAFDAGSRCLGSIVGPVSCIRPVSLPSLAGPNGNFEFCFTRPLTHRLLKTHPFRGGQQPKDTLQDLSTYS